MFREKRKRSANFSASEKMRFLRILQESGEVIISKVTSHDMVTNNAKEEAWIEITAALNASGNIIRTTDNLKKLWQKLKQNAKTFKSTSFHQTHDTCGIPSEKMDDPVLELVAEIIGRGSSGYKKTSDTDTPHININNDTASPKVHMGRKTLCACTPALETKSSTDHPINEVEKFIEVDMDDILNREEHVAPITQEHFKSRRPNLTCNDNERLYDKVAHVASKNTFASEILNCDKEKLRLTDLQKLHMIEEHKLKIKQLKLKNEILETVLQKIQDEKPVDPELLKILF